jgi:hypothetical protein
MFDACLTSDSQCSVRNKILSSMEKDFLEPMQKTFQSKLAATKPVFYLQDVPRDLSQSVGDTHN